MRLYIDAHPVVGEDAVEATLCALCLGGSREEVVLTTAPKARNELEAKYFALESALHAVESKGRPSGGVTVYTDCWMLVNQLQGKYEVKDPGFLEHKRVVEEMGTRLGGLDVRYVPRQENPAHRALEERKP